MKVKELIEKLSNQDPEAEVLIYEAEWNDYRELEDIEPYELDLFKFQDKNNKDIGYMWTTEDVVFSEWYKMKQPNLELTKMNAKGVVLE